MLLAPVRLIELMSACTSGVMTSAFGPGETVGWVEAPFAGAVVPGDGAGAALVGGDGGAVVGMGRPDRWVVVVVAKVGGGWGGGRVVVVESPGDGVCVVVVLPRPAELEDVVVPNASADHVPPDHVAAAVPLTTAATMTRSERRRWRGRAVREFFTWQLGSIRSPPRCRCPAALERP